MKIEIGESLACSWLRHVRQCWLVQANWKFLEHWERCLTDRELQVVFDTVRGRFDVGGGVFKKTRDAGQFLRQGEIDAVGVDHGGGVHGVEIAFHEAGLQYGTTTETNDRVLKKMLRTLLILRAFRPPETPLHIYFLSPKVNPVVQQPLEKTFAALRSEYSDVEWRFIANDAFTNVVVRPTLDKTSGIADSSELFVRSAKLLELVGHGTGQRQRARSARPHSSDEVWGSSVRNKIQPLVQNLMQTLLVDAPELLSAEDKRRLQDNVQCKELGLKIGNFALLRKAGLSTTVDGRRYYRDPYGSFCVCSQWWRQHHHSNAMSLLDFVKDVATRNDGNPGVEALQRHEQAFRDYLADV